MPIDTGQCLKQIARLRLERRQLRVQLGLFIDAAERLTQRPITPIDKAKAEEDIARALALVNMERKGSHVREVKGETEANEDDQREIGQ